jgi:hypothetical protein
MRYIIMIHHILCNRSVSNSNTLENLLSLCAEFNTDGFAWHDQGMNHVI